MCRRRLAISWKFGNLDANRTVCSFASWILHTTGNPLCLYCSDATLFAKAQEKCLEQAWQAALPLLLSPDISNGNEFTAPWLDYEPYLNGETDVYFLLDEPQERVKIGISGNLRQRVDTLKQQHNTNLRLISIIPAGGIETESALHLFFKKYRLDQKGLVESGFLIRMNYVNLSIKLSS